jgi:cytochrome c556
MAATPPVLSKSAAATTAAPAIPKGGRRSRKLSSASDSTTAAGGVERKQAGRNARQNAEGHVAYRQKRQRNNEAVRKCRIKKKEQSEERERQVADLEALVAKLRRENEALRTQLGRDNSSVHNTYRGTSVSV